MRTPRVVLVSVLVAAAGCGGSGSDVTGGRSTVVVHARVYNGATPAGAALNRIAAGGHMARSASPYITEAGNWLLSPDQLAVTITGLRLTGGLMQQTTVNCPATYDRSKPGLTQLVDCSMTVPTGTYTGIDVGMSATYAVTMNDTTHHFFTTASGIVSSPPSSGAQPFSVTLTSSGANGEFHDEIPFASPLTVSDTSNVSISVVLSGIQFLHVHKDTLGNVTMGWPGTTYTDAFRPDVAASTGPLASVEFYSVQALNTSGSYCANSCMSGFQVMGIPSVAVYYMSATQPAMVSIGLNGTPPNCGPFGVGLVSDTLSYLGLDANGNLGWAIPTTSSWTSYSSLMRMGRVSSVGGSTTLYCQPTSTDPAPPGGSFASGAPNIATSANSQGTFVLVAK